jgi:hypothetical protein
MKTIQEFERRLEQHVVSLEGERAQQYAGLEFSEGRMEDPCYLRPLPVHANPITPRWKMKSIGAGTRG